jgi:UDP-GlcNAc:undecaprenyl-phosphate GlcNAc-1-phosphate transferase
MIYTIIFLFATLIVISIIPSIIYVADEKLLFDTMDKERKNHESSISRFGGVAIFCGFMLSCLLFSQITGYSGYNYLLASCIILFIVGLKDDFWGVNPETKFGAQFISAAVIVFLANVRLTSFYGIFNVYDLSYSASVFLSVIVIVFLINAFNLIDGIDGLAGIIGLVINVSLGLMFIDINEVGLASMAFALAGTCLGFLRFNLINAKIFMGDTGALIIGFVSVFLALKFVELNKTGLYAQYRLAPSIVTSLFIIPAFDTLRVFTLRIINRSSPFVGDRTHIHHRLLDAGLDHIQATFTLLLFNISIIALAFGLRSLNNFIVMIALFVTCMLANSLLTVFVNRKKELLRLSDLPVQNQETN